MVGNVVAGSFRVQLCIFRKLEHVWSHHSTVLVVKDMAMVKESWILSQLVEWHVEVSIVSSFVVVLSPSYPAHKHLETVNHDNILPSLVIRLNLVHLISDILSISSISRDIKRFEKLSIKVIELLFNINAIQAVCDNIFRFDLSKQWNEIGIIVQDLENSAKVGVVDISRI